ncbi:sugar phosphate isomerase/epimerase [Prolixibacter sp. NT017]|uniref:sugar phosphate isomerase/epimerase family protein n=1 Tax=Prolixibacter sp. NT017 TaxID=2652390 RepID=UPI001271C6F8|nr:sugar phosphate isomerase/epimerase [Prolixibacter sp. NT017]GET25979.1 sugar phosphate isomerase [Prolixibacter sp. NT017]
MKLNTHLIKSVGLLLLVFLLSGLSSCKQTQKKQEKYIGLQLWSVRDHMKDDVKGTIEAVGKIGYKFIEAAGYADGKFYGMEPTAFADLVKANGMDFLSSHTGQAVPDSTNWDEVMAWWDQCIAAHKAAGVKYIVQPFMDNVGYESIEGVQRYCDYFNAVGEKCNAAGIRFGYHNHDAEFKDIDGQIIYDYMLQHTDPAKVFFEMDLYWITEGGKNPVDYFNQYPGRFLIWHVKDKTELGGDDSVMDFKPIFADAQTAGMKYIVVEVEEYNYDPLKSVEKSLNFLNNAPYVK